MRTFLRSRLGALAMFVATFVGALLFAWPAVYAPATVDVFLLGPAEAKVYLGSWYKEADQSVVPFRGEVGGEGDGGVTVMRGDAPIAPAKSTTVNNSDVRVYDTAVGDRVCLGETCSSLREAGHLASVASNGRSMWSGRHTYLSGFDGGMPRNMTFASSHPAQLLVVDFSNNRTTSLQVAPDAPVTPDLSGNTVLSQTRIDYAVLYSLLFAGAITFGIRSALFVRTAGALVQMPYFASAATVIVAVYYLAVFPGFFNSDTVIRFANASSYTIWYSSLYQVYTYLFVFIGFKLMQLVPALLILASALAFYRAAAGTGRMQVVVGAVLLLSLALSPVLFATVFSAQRYFVSAAILVFGLSLFALGLRSLVANPARSPLVSAAAVVLAGAALMRPEYWLIWLVVIGTQAFLGWREKAHAWFRRGLSHAALAVAAMFMLTTVLPLLHGVDTSDDKAKYELASLLDMARPYSGCEGETLRPQIRAQLEAAGGTDLYCSFRTEIFFSDRARGLPVAEAQALTRNLKSQLLVAMLEEPLPAARRFVVRAGEILGGAIWHIYDRYKDRDQVDFWQGQSDRFGLLTDPALPRPVYNTVMAYFTAIAHASTHFIVFSAVVAGTSLFLTWGQPISLLLSWAVLAISVVSVVLSPAEHWAYVVVLHLWAVFFLPFSAAESAATGRRPIWLRWSRNPSSASAQASRLSRQA